MADALTLRTMTRSEVDFAVGLAADEGWNPGLSDAGCFHAADPEGFFIAELDGRPVGVISAVRYGGGFGFVGLYIMVPEARGKGYGIRLWRHAMAHLEGCNVGLDAVTEQEATYRRDGFTSYYRSARYEGVGGGETPEGVTALDGVDFERIAAYDRCCFPGEREDFLRAWLKAEGARGFGVLDGDRLTGFGVIRPCVSGYKIGPLFADDGDVAERLYSALIATIPGEPFYLDVIEPNAAAMELAGRHALKEIFVTVRMYTGGEPAMEKDRIFGVTSFELG
ncbi:GNAT family N-acetyltransferase [Pseudodesulfovibrio cashew]|uniref:GNAT family N-acetyltransferase n=1 Tax=Pseudodesulfovibrio cashew TaxID=2678688 RepID=A0A6I6JDJ3_9BACT|nr:GNAT family N-acetyltransferase [Pseudodesulfovibrio cashew]QGY39229.1 GNAT family N-acetyltransferase [Pseudodesulfovibrio cashew]